MMKKAKAGLRENKLARLGILGIFGLVGLFSGIPYLGVFLVFLLFFLFTGVTPDEMFQQHVQKAGLRAFYTYLAATVAVILLVLFRAMSQNGSWYDSRIAASEQMSLMGDVFGWIFSITLCVFAFTLVYYTYKEKSALDEPMFGNLQDIIAENTVWGAITVYFCVSVGLSLVSNAVARSVVSTDVLDGSLYMILAYLMVTVVAVILAGELFGFSRLGLRRHGLGKGLLWGVPPIVLLCFLVYAPSGPLLFASFGDIAPLLVNIIFALLAIIALAFYSEVLCRGLTLNILMENWGHSRAGIWRSLLFSSAMFSLLVLVNSLLIGMPALMVFGNFLGVFVYSMFFGALYLRSGNLWATAVSYAGYLCFDTICGFLTVDGYSLTYALTVGRQVEPAMIIKSAICHALLLIPALILARGITPRAPREISSENILPEPEVNGHAENPA